MTHTGDKGEHPEPTYAVPPTGDSDREVRCPVKWCAYPMPHTHTQGTPAPSFDALLNDPSQQLDERSEVQVDLTTAQREWLDHAALYGNLHDVVGRMIAGALAAAGFRRPATGDTLTDTERETLRTAGSSATTMPRQPHIERAVERILADRRTGEAGALAQAETEWQNGNLTEDAYDRIEAAGRTGEADLRARAIRALIATGRHTVDTARAALATEGGDQS